MKSPKKLPTWLLDLTRRARRSSSPTLDEDIAVADGGNHGRRDKDGDKDGDVAEVVVDGDNNENMVLSK